MRKEEVIFNKGYRVCDNGEVINPEGIIVKGSLTNRGYLKIGVRYYGKIFNCNIHRLQAFQKYGAKLFKFGIEVRHLDGNKLNNSYDNILIGNHKQNMMDIPEHIRIDKSLHATSFVRKHNKAAIKKYHSECKSYKKTMLKFDISSKGTLHFILNN